MPSRRRRAVGFVAVSFGLFLAPAAAAAAPEGPPDTTPAGTGGGCRENGRVIADAARFPGAFGQTVRQAAPIADENAAFFTRSCRP